MNHILVVDDSAENRARLRVLLTDHDYVVDEACHGAEALLKARLDPPQLIIADLLLPVMDGYKLLRQWRADERLQQIPFVIYTRTDIHPKDKRLALDLGVDVFILHAAESQMFLAHIREALDQGAHRRLSPVSVPGGVGKVLPSPIGSTEYKHIDHAYDWLAAIVEHSSDAIISRDRDFRILTWNPVAERLFGWSAAEVIGRDTSLLIPSDRVQERARGSRRLDQGLSVPAYDTQRMTKSGQLVDVSVAMSPVRYQHGEIIAVFLVIREITERKQHEDAMRQSNEQLEWLVAERTHELEVLNHELEAFSYSVAHDLRAPLRAIDGFGNLVLSKYGDKLDDEGKDYLERMREGSRKMYALIEDLLRLSQISRQAMQTSPVDLSALAREVVSVLQDLDSSRQIEWSIAPEVQVVGDSGLLRVVLQNLLGNAWKYSAKRQQACIEFGVTEQADRPAYFVRDNGAGFDMAYASKLFGAFQRLHLATEFPGTGIGLAIVARIIQRHGGAVWAEGAVDQGATFWFTLNGVGGGGNHALK